ncbi:MAG: NTP transferase domain-containing protein [Candidatus Thermoplasmatota archaeon]|nr:NTP transferase domain-containing protein [Candidatus Thermoplasmatota archaeon]
MRGARPLRALILAAGASRRLGRPKALIEVEGTPVVRMLVNRLQEAGIDSVIVTRQELMFDIAQTCQDSTIVVNPTPDLGRTGTIRCGILHLISQRGGDRPFRLLIVPVDRPGFSTDTLRLLSEQNQCSVPSMDGRGGHPILLMPDDIERIVAEPNPDRPLRDLVNPVHLPVEDPLLHLNLDREEDLIGFES